MPLSPEEVVRLWQETIKQREFSDETIVVRCVGMAEMQQLNNQYRHQDKPTNVLTFSYEGEHDVVLCLPVAQAEAAGLGRELRDYVALLLVHAFLHVTGLNHEKSEPEEAKTHDAEKKIMGAAGFAPLQL